MSASRQPTVTVVGLGQLGALVSVGALRAGCGLVTVRRGESLADALGRSSAGEPIVVAVRDDSFEAVCRTIPAERHADVVLLQNGVYPRDWQACGLERPGFMVVWTNVKPGVPVRTGRAPQLWGPHSALLAEVLGGTELPAADVLADHDALLDELVAKDAFITAVNAAGVRLDVPVERWLDGAPDSYAALVDDALALACWRVGRRTDIAAAKRIVLEASRGLGGMSAAGRSAVVRTERALADGLVAGIELPSIAAAHDGTLRAPSLAPQDLRVQYGLHELGDEVRASDPLGFFRAWFDDAVRAKVLEPNAMVLGTASPDGPRARVVLLKGIEEDGLSFFTNRESAKGAEIDADDRVSLTFLWAELERQVRFEGRAERLSDEACDAYFAVRPRASQVGAWASAQSSEVADQATLRARFDEEDARWATGEVPRPPFWGGYVVRPTRIEFWQGRPGRLHDRIVFSREADGGWRAARLMP